KGIASSVTKDEDGELILFIVSFSSTITKFKRSGPITISKYMKEALTNPLEGYYTKKGDVFGVKGDFTTSPEISQMFGELIGIWFLTQWKSQGQPKNIQIVELGPGRGTLLDDILRALSKFKECYNSITRVNLVEVSQEMRKIQYSKLCEKGNKQDDRIEFNWYNSFEEIPDLWSMVIAHEFFDALPIHRFEKTDNCWREYLVDVDETDFSEYHFKLILSSEPTDASKQLKTNFSLSNSSFCPRPSSSTTKSALNFDKFKIGDKIEISPESFKTAKQISKYIGHNKGGAALLIDYGQDFIQGDTLRAIRNHKFINPMSSPGEVDLSVDVNFQYLKEAIAIDNLVNCYGPIPQSKFLLSLGISLRLMVLLRNPNVSKDPILKNELLQSYKRLVDPLSMGNIYKALAITPKSLSEKPFGF
ncbi:10323_t:CDS:2, partial [Entrophospora sp. SA101]